MTGEDDTSVPAAALLVRDFVNTVEWQEDSDSWASPDDLSAWFAERTGMAIGTPAERDLLLARRIREGLRSVLLQHAGHAPLDDAAVEFNDALDRVPLRMRVDRDGTVRLAGEGGVAGGLAAVLSAVEASRADGSWSRLKACSRDSCRWAYWDASRNRSGRWCSMAGCGEYAKRRARSGDPLGAPEVVPDRGEPRPATLVDVAARAAVSVKTVSNVVTGAVRVAPETRARVEAVIAELHYRPNLLARALRSGSSPDAGTVRYEHERLTRRSD